VDEGRHGSQVVMPLPPVSRRDYLRALVETAIFAPAPVRKLPQILCFHLFQIFQMPTPRDRRFALYQPAYNRRTNVECQKNTVKAGADATLGSIYRAVAAQGYALSAGTCPTVGVAGRALGGEYGFLYRELGLLCEALSRWNLWIRMVKLLLPTLTMQTCSGHRVLVFSLRWLPAARARNPH
jgi:hypothetical protein